MSTYRGPFLRVLGLALLREFRAQTLQKSGLSQGTGSKQSPSDLHDSLDPPVSQPSIRETRQRKEGGAWGCLGGACSRPRAERRRARRGHAGSRTAPRSPPGASCAMATPSLRGRLARLGNARKPILKPNKPLILTNRVGERRRERGGEQLEPWRPQSGSRRGAGGGWGEDRKVRGSPCD